MIGIGKSDCRMPSMMPLAFGALLLAGVGAWRNPSPGRAVSALAAGICLLLAITVVHAVAETRSNRRFLVFALITSSTLQAALVLAWALGEWGFPGTFVNHTHAATFIGAGLFVTVGELLRSKERPTSLVIAGVVCFLAMIVAASGIAIVAAFMTGLAVVASRPKIRWIAVAALAVGAGFLVLERHQLEHHFSIKRDRLAARVQVWTAAAPLVFEAPILGHGVGRFERLFPRRRPAALQLSVAHAHCEPLEVALDSGLLVAALAIAAAVVALKGMPGTGRSWAAVGVKAALGFMLFVSLFDFPLRLPALALLAAMLAGLSSPTSRLTSKAPFVGCGIAAVVLGLWAGSGLAGELLLARGEYAMAASALALDPRPLVAAAEAAVEGREPALAAELLAKGLKRDPEDALLVLRLAQLQAEIGEEDEAEAGFERSRRLDPLNENLAVSEVRARLRLGQTGAALERAHTHITHRPQALGYLLPPFTEAGIGYPMLRLLPQDSAGHERLARWLEGNGMPDEASVERTRARRLEAVGAAGVLTGSRDGVK